MSSVKRKKKLNSMTDNDDLLTEIMVRLPLKSLLRCKSVSKCWRSLISCLHFCRRLYPDPYLVSGLIFHRISFFINPEYDFVPLSDKPTGPPFNTLTFVNHPSGLKILQSYHGLLFYSNFPDMTITYTIPQPSNSLHFLALVDKIQHLLMVLLAYDPDKSPHCKVVCVRKPKSLQDYLGIYSRFKELYPYEHDYLINYSRYQIEIYSSEKRSWRFFDRSFIANDNKSFRRGVFWNGAIYWRGHSFYFNVNEEKLQKMPIPDVWKDGNRFGYLDASREHLHLAVISPCRTKFDVYEMKRDYCVDPSDLHYYKFAILGIIREADDGESYMVLHIPGKVIRYNLHDKTFIKIFDFSPGREDVEHICYPGYLRFNWFDDAYQCIETLACI